MRVWALALALVLVLLLTLPVAAFTPRERVGDADGIVAWQEGDTLFVAIGNESTVRRSVTVEVPGSRGRSPGGEQTVVVPGRSVLVQAFSLRNLAPPLRGGRLDEVVVSHRSGRRAVMVQQGDVYAVSTYVARYSTTVSIDVDFPALMGPSSRGHLEFDTQYQLSGGTGRGGRLYVDRFEGGYRLVPGQNVIAYEEPLLLMAMRIPYMNGIGIATFDVVRTSERHRPEVVAGPEILVYGADIRLIEEGDGPAGLITK